MELVRFNFVLKAAGCLILLWASGSVAAPMECHFNSKALCVFEGRQYAPGETWMDTCTQCTCLQPMGVGCCATVQRPVDFPAWCEVRVEPVTCKVTLVLAADRRLPCLPGEDMRDPSHGSQNQLAE
ncbi:prostate-associated microseminoprotein [Entelurus aequoreus]|uniref:prostate-associated microseminoprotein n=1 Tax=Entelurus aequoreus TaxID=161455 RepID=UPI002B1DAEDB|nr:prostate-associated microseminoprotein [Entelurus aequoreus]